MCENIKIYIDHPIMPNLGDIMEVKLVTLDYFQCFYFLDILRVVIGAECGSGLLNSLRSFMHEYTWKKLDYIFLLPHSLVE